MVTRARQVIPEDHAVQFAVADVRDLSALDRQYDFVLVSCNAFDTMAWGDRRAALKQIRSVTRTGGWLLLSGHSVHALRTHLPLHHSRFGRSAKEIYHWSIGVGRTARYLRERRKLDLDAVETDGRVMFRDGAHSFKLDIGYMSVTEQRRELAESGFLLVDVLDLTGAVIDASAPPSDVFLHYLARAVTGRDAGTLAPA
jgi:SAM-dependent methyltransferase